MYLSVKNYPLTYLLSFRLAVTLMFFVVVSQSAIAGLIRDTELETGLQDFAAPLVKAAGFSPNSIDFRIIIDSSYNAFVAGERAVYMHSGLLLDAKSPEEILGVIAHELGHIKARHVPRRDKIIRDASGASSLAALAAIAMAASGAPSDAVVGVAIAGMIRRADQCCNHSVMMKPLPMNWGSIIWKRQASHRLGWNR